MDEKYENERREIEYYIFQKNRKYLHYGISSTVIGLSIFLTKELILNFVDIRLSIAFVVTGTLTLAFGIGLLLYRYLQTGLTRNSIASINSNNSIRNEIEELRLEILRLRKRAGSLNENENLNEIINKIIDNTLSVDFISSKIDKAYTKEAIEQTKLKMLYQDFENLGFRIDGELGRLRRSANLNLVIGTLTTSVAIFALGYEVFKANLDFTDTVKLLAHYLPRLSLVIFIEIFAFFFLKLYKANLQDIKYFNNEKTNIDFKVISLKIAIHQGNQELIKLTIEELIRTERNFKLSKNESTVELEKSKLDKENNKYISQILSKLTDKI
jgi:hypothetical protein